MTVIGNEQRHYGTLISGENCNIFLHRFALVYGGLNESPSNTSATVYYGDDSMTKIVQCGYKYGGYLSILWIFGTDTLPTAAVELRICKLTSNRVVIMSYGEQSSASDASLWFNYGSSTKPDWIFLNNVTNGNVMEYKEKSIKFTETVKESRGAMKLVDCEDCPETSRCLICNNEYIGSRFKLSARMLYPFLPAEISWLIHDGGIHGPGPNSYTVTGDWVDAIFTLNFTYATCIVHQWYSENDRQHYTQITSYFKGTPNRSIVLYYDHMPYYSNGPIIAYWDSYGNPMPEMLAMGLATANTDGSFTSIIFGGYEYDWFSNGYLTGTVINYGYKKLGGNQTALFYKNNGTLWDSGCEFKVAGNSIKLWYFDWKKHETDGSWGTHSDEYWRGVVTRLYYIDDDNVWNKIGVFYPLESPSSEVFKFTFPFNFIHNCGFSGQMLFGTFNVTGGDPDIPLPNAGESITHTVSNSDVYFGITGTLTATYSLDNYGIITITATATNIVLINAGSFIFRIKKTYINELGLTQDYIYPILSFNANETKTTSIKLT